MSTEYRVQTTGTVAGCKSVSDTRSFRYDSHAIFHVHVTTLCARAATMVGMGHKTLRTVHCMRQIGQAERLQPLQQRKAAHRRDTRSREAGRAIMPIAPGLPEARSSSRSSQSGSISIIRSSSGADRSSIRCFSVRPVMKLLRPSSHRLTPRG